MLRALLIDEADDPVQVFDTRRPLVLRREAIRNRHAVVSIAHGPLADIVVERRAGYLLVAADEATAMHEDQHRSRRFETSGRREDVEPLACIAAVLPVALHGKVISERGRQRQGQLERGANRVRGNLARYRANRARVVGKRHASSCKRCGLL
jgi:hypothetical protein